MHCPKCNSQSLIRWGKTAAGQPRRRCKDCRATTSEPRAASPIAPMRIPLDRAVLCLSLLVEGNSIRATERITGTHRDTLCRLLVLAAGKCEALLAELIRNVPVAHVETDELWAFIAKTEATKAELGETDPEMGDSYTFLALDADSKLILAHHVGRRTSPHADAFMEKLSRATAGRFQLTTSAFTGYPEAVSFHLGNRTDYATLAKEPGTATQKERQQHSQPRILAATKTPVHGDPEEDRICTSHAERLNLDVRMKNRRFTRQTNAFSKLWRNHRASVALTVAHYNLCKMHRTIRMTPAMKAGLTHRIWTVAELLTA